MPLLDHFHAPLRKWRHWHSFHNGWATFIASALNAQIPKGYFAEPNVHYGIEIDVAAFEHSAWSGGTSSPAGWVPPAAQFVIPLAITTDIVEVRVLSDIEGPTLAGAIELVSPSNKDRAEQRDAFVSKCASYVQSGVGLVIVDIVTDRNANLHAELMKRLGTADPESFQAPLYASAYRPAQEDEATTLHVWREALEIGQPLPTLSLWLRGGVFLPVGLEATYERTVQELLIRETLNGSRASG